MQAAKENIEKKKEALAKLTANADELEVKAKVGGVSPRSRSQPAIPLARILRWPS